MCPRYIREGSDIKDPTVGPASYDRIPLTALYQLTQLMKLVRQGLHRVWQPTLIFKSDEDHVIPRSCADYTLDRISSLEKSIVRLVNSYHVATLDYDKEIISRETIRFIRKIVGEEQP